MRHGWRPERREESLEQARRTAHWLNGLGWLVTLWLLAYPTPYQVCVAVAVSLPMVGVVAIWLHPGTLRIDELANNAYPSLLPLFLMPSLLLALRALLDYDILEYASLWQLVVPGAALLLLLLAMVNREFMVGGRAGWPSWVLLLFMALPYSYGAAVLLNCSFDTSAVVVHPAAVVRKYTSGDFPTSYQLQLSPWPQRPTANTEATISKRVYQQIVPGDSVSVAAHAGYLGISWFSVGQR
ncbi:hypothetical protein CDA63_00550 [Hymenobacter amundsenii]|uniref:Uncharacterized protein n=1 Tax=Hymenobacter amundsenii TaxID=2006685 RepID=A0A246FQ74_9BACT|nr:hypothetical protein [Hymenobacter amundsenii]OWP64882.1 hypothetical protein CDA63_00550 [Hymenobacter amundsenii]